MKLIRAYGRGENRLIWGDNLPALDALKSELAGKIRCVYIDPPYNTGNDFGHYQDALDPSAWLAAMRATLERMRDLLRPDGTLFVQLDDAELAYCKVLLDEIFGRHNFLNQIAVHVKRTAGASGGGEDRRLKKNLEYILVYVRDAQKFRRFHPVYEERDLFSQIDRAESWKYTSVLVDEGRVVDRRTLKDGAGEPIVVERRAGMRRTTVGALMKERPREQVYREALPRIFADTNAQSTVRTRIIDGFGRIGRDELLIARYVPRSGEFRGRRVTHHYISPSVRRVIWLRDIADARPDGIVIKERLGTYWSGLSWNNVSKEGDVVFPGKKPEALLARILRLATDEGDRVLDAFGGSGTTAAAAHKLGRRWILIERGEQARTHALKRLKSVVAGEDDSGISAEVGWKGGGGFGFYR